MPKSSVNFPRPVTKGTSSLRMPWCALPKRNPAPLLAFCVPFCCALMDASVPLRPCQLRRPPAIPPCNIPHRTSPFGHFLGHVLALNQTCSATTDSAQPIKDEDHGRVH